MSSWLDGWMDGGMCGQMNSCLDGLCPAEWKYGLVDGCTHG